MKTGDSVSTCSFMVIIVAIIHPALDAWRVAKLTQIVGRNTAHGQIILKHSLFIFVKYWFDLGKMCDAQRARLQFTCRIFGLVIISIKNGLIILSKYWHILIWIFRFQHAKTAASYFNCSRYSVNYYLHSSIPLNIKVKYLEFDCFF